MSTTEWFKVEQITSAEYNFLHQSLAAYQILLFIVELIGLFEKIEPVLKVFGMIGCVIYHQQ